MRDTSTVNGITYATLNEKIKSPRSIHFIAGYDYRFRINNLRYRFTAEAYYKALGNLIPYSVNNVKVVYYGENRASGHAAGIDLKLYGEFVPGTDSWLTFSLMNTQMKLNGKGVPLPTDQRFAVNLFFTDYFPGTERWRMSLKLARRRFTILYTTQRTGDQYLPSTSLQTCRHRYELSPARQQQGDQEEYLQEYLAGGRLPQSLRYRQRQQLLLGNRCNQPAVCSTELSDRQTGKWPSPHRILIISGCQIIISGCQKG